MDIVQIMPSNGRTQCVFKDENGKYVGRLPVFMWAVCKHEEIDCDECPPYYWNSVEALVLDKDGQIQIARELSGFANYDDS